ncbi:unnamed protein product [Moneuplotes crassus]|uniref:BACK domain-containing protein n=1 Tax=Euplotes crassus TaxID=5936 RepID=A0AAD1Y9C0_EUPCR|nr:unnamed protein product [Moneuplotes crassus]
MKQETKQEVYFILKQTSIQCSAVKLKKHSVYFRKTLKDIKEEKIRLILPNWASLLAIRVLVKFVSEDLLPKEIEPIESLKVIWLCDYFKISELVFIMIETFIIPQLEPGNVIQFINEAYAKLKSIGKNCITDASNLSQLFEETPTNSIIINREKEEDAWYSLLDKSLDYMSKNNPMSILKKQNSQMQVPKAILDEICERVHRNSNSVPDHQILKFICSVKDKANIPELLHHERKTILDKAENNGKPILTWEVCGLTENCLKESDPFLFNEKTWTLSVWYIKGSLQICIRHIEQEQTCDMLKSETSFLPSAKGYISFQYKVVINDDEANSKSNLISLSPYMKDNCVLFNQKYELKEQLKFKIHLHMSIKYTYAACVTAISSDFSTYYQNENFAELLDFQTLLLLFKSDDLDVVTEDHVFETFVQWYDFQTKKPNLDQDCLNDQIRQLCDQIRWQYVSLAKVTQILTNRPKLGENTNIRRIYKEELKARLTSIESHLFSNSYSRVSINERSPRKSYEYFIREESAESIINSLADVVLNNPQTEEESMPFESQSETTEVEIGIIEDYDQENMNFNLNTKTRRTTESHILLQKQREFDSFFSINRTLPQLQNNEKKKRKLRNSILDGSMHNFKATQSMKSPTSKQQNKKPPRVRKNVSSKLVKQFGSKLVGTDFKSTHVNKPKRNRAKTKTDRKKSPRIGFLKHETKKFKRPSIVK